MKTLLPNVRCQTIQPDVYFWFPGSNKTPVNLSKVSRAFSTINQRQTQNV